MRSCRVSLLRLPPGFRPASSTTTTRRFSAGRQPRKADPTVEGGAMIHALVDFSLKNRFLILTAATLLLIWGGISFHNLPVEAYPDVANNYVTIITQWPG